MASHAPHSMIEYRAVGSANLSLVIDCHIKAGHATGDGHTWVEGGQEDRDARSGPRRNAGVVPQNRQCGSPTPVALYEIRHIGVLRQGGEGSTQL